MNVNSDLSFKFNYGKKKKEEKNSLLTGLPAAGKFALWMLPQLFAYALNFPIQKFLQAQRKVLVMAWISAVVLVLHTFFSWLLILKLGWGLTGAAITLNTSWWLIVIIQLLYIFITKSDGAWAGFSWLAFADLWGFVKLSLASAVMLWCVSVTCPFYLG
jgi:MATE family multidrug resistance protein